MYLRKCGQAELGALFLDKMCLVAKKPSEISYCVDCISFDKEKTSLKKELLKRLEGTEASFTKWKKVILSSSSKDNAFLDIAFSKMKEKDADFKTWKTTCSELKQNNVDYLRKAVLQLSEKADSFQEKEEVLSLVAGRVDLFSKIVNDMKNMASTARELVRVHCDLMNRGLGKDAIKIITLAEDTFENWLYINQTALTEWLITLSLKKMKEMAKEFRHWSIIWCRDSSKEEKKQACSKMIEMATNYKEAKLAWYRAKGTVLEKEAKKKLGEIIKALQ